MSPWRVRQLPPEVRCCTLTGRMARLVQLFVNGTLRSTAKRRIMSSWWVNRRISLLVRVQLRRSDPLWSTPRSDRRNSLDQGLEGLTVVGIGQVLAAVREFGLQITTEILKALSRREWQVDDKIPGEAAPARRFRVARVTVHQASAVTPEDHQKRNDHADAANEPRLLG